MITRDRPIEIPITKNCVFALSLDSKTGQEHVIIGELEQVQRCLIGYKAEVLIDKKRSFGSFFSECTIYLDGSAISFGDVRTILCGNTGKKKSDHFDYGKRILETLWRSDNLIFKFVAVRMWQEYLEACKYGDFDLIDTLEIIPLALFFNIKKEIKRYQDFDPQYPWCHFNSDYFFHPAHVLYTNKKTIAEYVAADLSLLPLVIYYLKRAHDQDSHIQACKYCGNLFLANTARIPTLCSDNCKREMGRINKRRHDEKTKIISYEKAYDSNYSYWHNRLQKLRKSNASPDHLAAVEEAFETFRKEAIRRKKEVAAGKADTAVYEEWLLEQRDVIDGLVDLYT